MAREILTENMQDFLAKSERGADRLGTKWKPLAQSTIRRKRNAMINQTMKNARKRKRYKKQIQSEVLRLRKLGYTYNQALSIATNVARLKVGGQFKVPINIETDKMRLSIRPGKISGKRYYPPPNQVVQQSRSFLRVSTKIPYAKYTFDPTSRNPRPIMMPAKMQAKWAKKALVDSMDAVIGDVARGSFVLSRRN